MSLLEDVFLQDEAGEAQELERIIEGDDEYDERPRPTTPNSDDNSEKEDEAEEDKRHVDPASAKPKRVVKNPRVILNPARLTGPRGIQVIPEHFKDFKFKGKEHEKEDLDLVLKKLEHWAYRLFPKFQFADCLKKIETLGNKRPVMVHLTKIRTDQFMSDDTVVQRDSSDEETPQPVPEEDEFDKLLQQQIELARATPAPGSVRKPAFSTPVVDKLITMPKATSSPSINEVQRDRMIRNRQLAEERRLARLKQNTSQNVATANKESTNHVPDTINENSTTITKETEIVEQNTDIITIDEEENISKVKNNRSNVIESSDEDDALVINESVTVDVHNNRNDDSDSDFDSLRKSDGIQDDEVGIRSEDIEINEVEPNVGRNSESISVKNVEELDRDDNLRVVTSIDSNNHNEVRLVSEDVEMNEIEAIVESTNDSTSDKNIEESNNLELITDIASNKHFEETASNINADAIKTKNGNENSNLNKDLDISTNNFEANSNHEGKNMGSNSSDEDIVEPEIEQVKTDKENLDSPKTQTNETDSHKEKQVTELEDIMDVDFSDDF